MQNPLIHTAEDGTRYVSLSEGKRILFLTKDPALIRSQLSGEVDLCMKDVDPADLLDDINTDVMTPAWVCFRHKPADIAVDAYAGLLEENEKGRQVSCGAQEGRLEILLARRAKRELCHHGQ